MRFFSVNVAVSVLFFSIILLTLKTIKVQADPQEKLVKNQKSPESLETTTAAATSKQNDDSDTDKKLRPKSSLRPHKSRPAADHILSTKEKFARRQKKHHFSNGEQAWFCSGWLCTTRFSRRIQRCVGEFVVRAGVGCR